MALGPELTEAAGSLTASLRSQDVIESRTLFSRTLGHRSLATMLDNRAVGLLSPFRC